MTMTLTGAPRAVCCVLDHAHRDTAAADAVCRGVFAAAGQRLDLGLEPDWHDPRLPVDEEWRIEWTKFYFGLDLAHAFAETGAVRYQQAWERLVRSWLARVPPGTDRTEVAARRVQNWIYAWNRFADAPGFRGFAEGLEADLASRIAAECRFIEGHLTARRNHRTLELYALFVAALAFPGHDPDGARARRAARLLFENLCSDVRGDGVHCEASTHYHCIVLRSHLGTIENARRFDLELDRAYDEHVVRACEFVMHVHRPDGAVPAFSDADSADYRDVLLLAARLFDRADFLYVATRGRRGIAPRACRADFPEAGYYVQRSGWGNRRTPFASERFLLFDCGPLGDGGHGHYDLLSLEVAAGGGPLLVDPGRYTYSEAPPNWRRWFKSTSAHNTVTVDGQDQTPYRAGRPKGPVAAGRLLARVSAPRLDVLVGEARSPVYDAVHARTVVFVSGDYWLVVDHLDAASEHEYDVRWHFSPHAGRGIRFGRDAADTAVVTGCGVTLLCHRAGDVRLEEGWHAATYGQKVAAPVVTVRRRGRRTTFVTAIVPTPMAGRPHPAPRLTVRELGESPGGRTTLQLQHGDGSHDIVTFAASPHDLALAGFRGRASAAFVRVGADGRVEGLQVAGFESGAWDARDLVHGEESSGGSSVSLGFERSRQPSSGRRHDGRE